MRLFNEHIIRKSIDLNGVWEFVTDKDKNGDGKEYIYGFKGDRVIVPSCWNNDLGLLSYEGVAWYQKKFYTAGGTLRFCFDGVMTQADVYLDGEKLGSHYGGFCEFSFIKKEVTAGEHTLVVRVDNGFDENSIPQKLVDWWHCGGITRSVSIQELDGVCVLYDKIDYELDIENKTAKILATFEIYNASDSSISDVLKISLGSQKMEKRVELNAAEKKTVEITTFLQDVTLWDTENPYLYTLEVKTASDDLYDRIGFRLVEVTKDGIFLNGQKKELRGVNRHEEHPDWGFAFPLKLMKRDLDICDDMGVNAIRGSHYPNSRAFLDYCDERGMMFWSEIPIWGNGFSPETLAREEILSRGLEMHKEMVRYYFNHPSIIIWGMHNEIRSETQEGYAMSKLYYEYLKENGGNRIVTYASHKLPDDICFEFCDIICINKYVGWYEGEIEDWGEFIEEIRARRKALNMEEKPVIISEFGAGAIYGHTTFDEVRWTEEHQAKLIAHCLELFHNEPMICGSFIWQFANTRSARDINRARYFNNKGVLNEYRNPKLAYFRIKETFEKFKAEENK